VVAFCTREIQQSATRASLPDNSCTNNHCTRNFNGCQNGSLRSSIGAQTERFEQGVVSVAGGDGERQQGLASTCRHVLVGLVGSATSIGGALLAQVSEIELSVAGVAGLLLTLVVRFRLSRGGNGGSESPRSNSQSFQVLRDADVDERNDRVAFGEYRRILAEANRKWTKGELITEEACKVAKDSALAFVLNTECLRLRHAEKRLVTLVIVQGGAEFVVKRVAPPELGARVYPGLHCHHDTSLEALARRYAECCYVAEYPVGGDRYHLVALSDAPLSSTGEAIVEDAASHYQSTYQFFRMAVIAPPPILPPASAEA
jgi:hypothetical protein